MAQTNGSNGTQYIPAVQKLRALLAQKDKLIVCPGVYDGFTARIALAEPIDCLYMTGAGTTMSRLGQPDMGIATMNDMRDHATMIANLDPSVPLIADADTGYGGAIMVGRTVTGYIRAGVAGLHLEDQVVSKRCGHLNGKQIVDLPEFVSRIKAAKMARDRSHGDIVIIARTDALQSLGYEKALERMKAAVHEGADVAFLEGVTDAEMAKRFCRDMGETPCLFNNVPGGVSPDLSVEETRQCGYRIAIYPAAAMEVVYPAVKKAVQQLLRDGKIESPHGNGKRSSPRELFQVCGLNECMEFDREAGGTAYSKDA